MDTNATTNESKAMKNTNTPATITDLGEDYITATAADGTVFQIRYWAIPAALSFIGAAVTVTQEMGLRPSFGKTYAADPAAWWPVQTYVVA